MFNLSKSKHINFKDLHQAADNLIGRIPPIKKRRRLNLSYKILKYFSLTIVFLFLLSLILVSSQIFNLKQIYDQANFGKVNLEQAVIFARQDDFSQAASLAKNAENNFNFSINKLEEIKNNNFINYLPFVLNQLNDAESLLISFQFLHLLILLIYLKLPSVNSKSTIINS